MKKNIFHADLDAAFATGALEEVRAAVLAPPMVPLKSLQLIPVNSAIDPGAEVYTYRAYSLKGKAEFIADKASDLPSVNTDGSEASVKLYNIGDSFDFSFQELKAAQFAGVPLDARKAEAARRAIDIKLDEIGQSGDTAHGLVGLLNLSGTCTYTVPGDGSGSAKTWASKTGALIVRDMFGMAQQIVTDTNEIERPDTLVIPPAQFALIQSTPYSAYTDTSILSTFLGRSQDITQVVPWSACDDAASGPLDRMVAYRRSSDVLEYLLPVPFFMFPTESRNGGMVYYTACYARVGGVVCYRPKAVVYGDGI